MGASKTDLSGKTGFGVTQKYVHRIRTPKWSKNGSKTVILGTLPHEPKNDTL